VGDPAGFFSEVETLGWSAEPRRFGPPPLRKESGHDWEKKICMEILDDEGRQTPRLPPRTHPRLRGSRSACRAFFSNIAGPFKRPPSISSTGSANFGPPARCGRVRPEESPRFLTHLADSRPRPKNPTGHLPIITKNQDVDLRKSDLRLMLALQIDEALFALILSNLNCGFDDRATPRNAPYGLRGATTSFFAPGWICLFFSFHDEQPGRPPRSPYRFLKNGGTIHDNHGRR